ncbi:hypothetical protein VOLCADRAFT_117506, partial [Volvox carteri f. nagariensis]
MRDFFGCYLLFSLAPEGKGRTYIGWTYGLKVHGQPPTAHPTAQRVDKGWGMEDLKIQALQFEWAWQHPLRSVIVRPIAQALGSKKLQGVRGKILLMLSMLHESPWRHFPLTLQYLNPKYEAMIKETVVSAPCHVRVFTAPLEDLPRALDDLDDDEDEDDPDSNEEQDEQEELGEGGVSGRERN